MLNDAEKQTILEWLVEIQCCEELAAMPHKSPATRTQNGNRAADIKRIMMEAVESLEDPGDRKDALAYIKKSCGGE